jgi:glutamate synthase domain-containing protein 3
MSAGVAYVLDTAGKFASRCNTELVEAMRIDDDHELETLRSVVELHERKTRSAYATSILADWANLSGKFWRVLPRGTSTSASDFVNTSFYDDTMLSASH